MKYVIWNKTKDMFWSENTNDWSNRFYSTKYSLDELEDLVNPVWFDGSNDLILAVISINV